MYENTLLQELNVEKIFKDNVLEDVVKMEKLLETEIEHKRRDLRSMVGDRYKDILAASDAIKSMENISRKIVQNIDHITSTSQALVNSPVVLNQDDNSEMVRNTSEERSLIIQLRLALFMNNQIWTALEEENNLQAAQCYVFAQHLHTGLDLTRSNFLNRVPLLGLLKGNLAHLRTTIYQQISLKLECVELTSEEAIYNLNAQLLLENPTEGELLNTFIKHRDAALDTVMKTQYSNVRLLVSALTKCLLATFILFHQCFIGQNERLGKVWFGENENNINFSLFHFPMSPLAKFIPDVIKQFKVKMKTLKKMCIKTVCKNVKRISTFINLSPLPWGLTEEVVQNYSKYKWSQLYATPIEYNPFVIMDFEHRDLEEEISPELRQALIECVSLEDFADRDYYCAWFRYYKISKYNMLLCRGCYKAFKDMFIRKGKTLNAHRDHFHMTCLASELHTLFQRKSSWCQNSYCELLFELKYRYECDKDLHQCIGKKARF